MTLWAEINGLGEYKIAAKINFSWPRLSFSKVVMFPMTAVGNSSFIDIPIINPSNSPIVVQSVLANYYGSRWSHFVQGYDLWGNNGTESKSLK